MRRNTIYDCGQNGIVGHLGCVFSTIEDNHIYNIAIKREFYGYEIAGIKLHAALDVIIRHNRIHDCSLGIWLDWQTQGTRVSRNLCYGNSRDLFIEVSHGPYLVEHNVLASAVSLELFSQGGAFVNNLVCGTVTLDPVLERPTPYHVPHSTQVAGYAAIHGGDDRYIGNIFLGGDPASGLRTELIPARAASRRPRHRRLRRTPGLAGGLPRVRVRSDQGRPRALHERQAAGLHPRQRLRQPGPRLSRPRRGRSSSPAATSPPRSSTKAPRSTWTASCRNRSTTSGSIPSAEPTSYASASSTPTSRNPTAPRSCWAPTWSESPRRRPTPTRPAPSPPSPQAGRASASGSDRPEREAFQVGQRTIAGEAPGMRMSHPGTGYAVRPASVEAAAAKAASASAKFATM